MEAQERAPSPPPLPIDVNSADGGLMLADANNSQDFVVGCVPRDEGSPPVNENALVPPDAASLYDDIVDKIARQVEYYFSDENLPNDKFLLNQMRKNKEGYVPIAVIASFKRMKKLTKDLSLIEAALRTSSLIVLSSDGKLVKRLHPLPLAEVRGVKPQTVLVENLPADHSEDNIRRIFGNAGRIVKVAICDPHSEDALTALKKTDFAICRKLHALIEFDTVEAAENAVSTLNDENNWSGMRVQLLLKRMEKFAKNGIFIRGRKDIPLDKNAKNDSTEPLEMLLATNQDASEKEEEKLSNGDSSKGRRRRNSNTRGRGHHHQPTNDQGTKLKPISIQGRSNVPFGSSSEGGIANKPIPGPKMPDGTRGFAMGRGKPIST